MIGHKKILAVIPARGGSKRLPRKNILSFSGRPLIFWTIQAATLSKYIDKVVVSTDDNEISEISRYYGAEVPFLRPKRLATDLSSTADVVLDLLGKLESKEEEYDYVVLLQPTSPFRNSYHIDDAIEQLNDQGSDAVISVCPVRHHPSWCNTLGDDKSMDDFLRSDLHNVRSQDLPKNYIINGAIYLCKTSVFKLQKTFFPTPRSHAYIMRTDDSIDIDTELDFKIAECLSQFRDLKIKAL